MSRGGPVAWCRLRALRLLSRTPADPQEPRARGPSQRGAGLAGITAAPAAVPDGPGVGTTTISWTTGDGSIGQVYVSATGGPEGLFATGAEGAQEASWIHADAAYTFRLYSGTEREKLLAAVVVTRGNELVETLIDVLIVLALVLPVGLIGKVSYRACKRAALAVGLGD